MYAHNSKLSTINASIVHWDVYSLPIRDACLDHIVTDLPFGKKIGSKERNMFLYPKALREMARVCRAGGRAILLTHHKEAMKKALSKIRDLWRFTECRRINMGGMNVCVYMLIRTEKAYVPWATDKLTDKFTKKTKNDNVVPPVSDVIYDTDKITTETESTTPLELQQ